MGEHKPLQIHQQLSQSLSIRGDRLFVEDCDTKELAEKFETPFFVVSKNHLLHNLHRYQKIFKHYWQEGSVKIIPSIKASPIIAIRKILSKEGAGCDVFGSGELEGAIRGNTLAELISVNGSIKDRGIIRKAIDIGATIVVDSPRELELCQEEAEFLRKQARIMLRLKPYMADLEALSDYVPDQEIRILTQKIKYGIPSTELFPMGKRVLELSHVDLIGIHAHMGRHSRRADVWEAWIKSCVILTKELSDEMQGWQPQEINIGGGFPSLPDQDTDVAIKGYDGPPLEELAETITRALREELSRCGFNARGITLALEPGRGIHCDTGIHLTSVKNIKREQTHIDHQWAEVDTSQMFLGIGGANFDQNKFEFVIANKANQEPDTTMDIVGKTCNLEILFYQAAVPSLNIDDVIALLNTGSYIEPCAQNFNALPRPGTLLVDGNHAEWIKRPETVDDVFSRDIITQL